MKKFHIISHSIRLIRKTLFLTLFFETLKLFAIMLAGFIFIIVPACYFFSCSRIIFSVIGSIYFLISIIILVIDVIIASFKILTLKQTVRFIEKRFPTLNGDLISAYQFEYAPADIEKFSISKNLAEAHIEKTKNAIPEKFLIKQHCLPHKQLGKYWVYLCALMISPLLFFSDFYASAIYNTCQNFTDQEITLKELLIVNPGNIDITYGSSCNIQAVMFTTKKTTPYLHYKKGSSKWRIRIMKKDRRFRFSFNLNSIKEPVEYFVKTPYITSPIYLIEPIKRPLILKHEITYRYPAYTQWKPKYEKRMRFSDIKTLKGTQISIKIFCNNIISAAYLNTARDNESFLFTANKTNTAEIFFKVTQNDEYNIKLIDNKNQENIPLKLFRIIAASDKKPDIQIVSPKPNIEMPKEMEVQIRYKSSDDIGIGKIELIYSISQSKYQSFDLFTNSEKTVSYSGIYNWDLKKLLLAAGDEIVYKLKVYDIYPAPMGPNTAESNIHSIRFPSIVEIYKRRAEVFDEPQNDISKLYDKHKLLLKKFKYLSDKLKNSDNMSWNDKKTANEIIQTQQSLQQQLEEQSKRIMQSIDELEISYDIVKKYSQIQEIMDNLLTQKMKTALRQLQEMIRNSDSFKNIKAQMQQLQLDMEQYNKNLDRTMELLKKLSVQNSIKQLLDTLKKAMEQQKEINRKLYNRKDNNMDKIDKNYFDKKIKDTEKIAEHIKNELKNIADNQSINDDNFRSAIKETQKLFKDQNIMDKLAELKKYMGSNNKNKSFQAGKMIYANFSSMKTSLENLLDMLLRQKNLIKNITYIIHRSIRVTRDLNELINDIEKSQGKNVQKNLQHAEEMFFIENELNRISDKGAEAAKESPIIAPAFYNPFRKISSDIKRFNEPLFKKGSQTSVPLLKTHLSELNLLSMQWVSLLETIIRAKQQGGKREGLPSSLEDFFKQLEELAKKQEKINNKTSMIPNLIPSTPSLQQYIQQLANEQRILSEALSKLTKQLGGQKRVLGSLNDIVAQMEKASRLLNSQQITGELKTRQKQILTRLLDAQKSLRKRDKSEKRKSVPGQITKKTDSPTEIDKDIIKRKLENIIRQGNSAYIPEDYIEMVKEYFRLLMESK
ncbi:hypothetical protein J7L67_09560 [bacterium]|nr:hypothetical protein [bacterium]